MKTGRTAPDIYKTISLRIALNICKILLPLDGHNGTHGVSKVYKDKASEPVLDIEEVTVLLSTNVKA